MQINDSIPVILAALRHWQRSIEQGHDLSAYADIVDPGALSVDEIDSLCESINTQSQSQPRDVYQVVTLSKAHLSFDDIAVLEWSAGQNMIMESETGFFVKLYEDDSNGAGSANYRDGYSDTLKGIIRWAHDSGYRMIEFDSDGMKLERFPSYE
ncbi:hypothetical protein [Marinimicrobium sp. ABcell2]|uniref:DUF5983 family protein n=1 Tax=Marinimicrobium sp. ABcell2 TaxID=3069751 RepID=UPI0027AFB896|nr:hypothetical protein [Marinimicrobium sp. ABcell2]MDQ2077511.1 hypothetical protein [Marinimicrobium sp. ABcell2]